jgi:2-polyprenyl-6-methoxyphenol hydroxylase-like FAD-dependent oxidoreductase
VSDNTDILIVGGGIGGLTLALSLHQAGISSCVFETAPEVQPLGVGINILPHGMRELCELGLQDMLAACAIETRELAFYSRHGQFIYKEPRGRYAGYDWPQLSIHRADLHKVLLDATVQRLGRDAVRLAIVASRPSRTAPASRCTSTRPSRDAARLRWAATASIRPCAGSSIPSRARRSTRASTCGAARCAGLRS